MRSSNPATSRQRLRVEGLGDARGRESVSRPAVRTGCRTAATAGDVRVYAIPLRTRFRGLTVRDGVLVRGDAGWGEFSPVLGLRRPRSPLAWWRAAREAADVGWPAPVRDRVPVNVTVPAVGPDEAARRSSAASGGCRTAKVKVAEPGQDAAPDDLARLEAVRDALGPGGRIRVDANGAGTSRPRSTRLRASTGPPAGWSTSSSRARPSTDLAGVRRRVARPDRRRRVDPPRRGPARASCAPTPPTSWCSRCSRSAGSGRACELAEQIGLPVVVSSALETSVGLAAGRRARRRAAGAAVRLRPGDRPAARRRRRGRPAAAGRRRTSGRRARDPDARRGSRPPAPTRRPPARWAGGSRPSVAVSRVTRAVRHRRSRRTPPACSSPSSSGAGSATSCSPPGSRTAPLAYALAEAARRRRAPAALRVRARAGRRAVRRLPRPGPARAAASRPAAPVAVVTTSGTAVGQPAPRRPRGAPRPGVPLLVLTADRPHELRGTGANQTTDQVGLFGRAVRLYARRPAPPGAPGLTTVRPRAHGPRPGRRARHPHRRPRSGAPQPRVPRAAGP